MAPELLQQLPSLLLPHFESQEEAARWIGQLTEPGEDEADAGEAFAESFVGWCDRLASDPALLETESLVAQSGEVSARLLAWLDATGLDGSDSESYMEAVRTWSQALNHVLAARTLPFRFRRIMPGQRFDHDRMESLASESGHHLKVAHPLAWIVYEDGDEGTRILRRGQVTTT